MTLDIQRLDPLPSWEEWRAVGDLSVKCVSGRAKPRHWPVSAFSACSGASLFVTSSKHPCVLLDLLSPRNPVAADVYDPWVSAEEAQHEYGITLAGTTEPGAYNGIILAVAHREFGDMGDKTIRAWAKHSMCSPI